MLKRFLRLLPALLVFFSGIELAHADMYRWTDASGRINVSNLPPPDGVKVTSVTKETPQDVTARYEALHEAARQAEAQAMADRIRQLEVQVEVAQRPVVAPPVQYIPVPITVPAPVQYQYPQYPVEMAQPAYGGGCDPSWGGCGGGWYPGFYPQSVIVINSPVFHRGFRQRQNPGFLGLPPLQGIPALRPMHATGLMRRG